MFNLFETDGERAQRENNEAQADASKAGTLDQLAHDLIGKSFQTEEYNKAYDATRDFKSGQEAGKEAGFFGQLVHDLTKDSNSKAHNDGFANGIDNKPSAFSGGKLSPSSDTPSSPAVSSTAGQSSSYDSDTSFDGERSSYKGPSCSGTGRPTQPYRKAQASEKGVIGWEGAWNLLLLPFRAIGMFLLCLIAYPVPTLFGCLVVGGIIYGIVQGSTRPNTPGSYSTAVSGGAPTSFPGEHFPQTRSGYLGNSEIDDWSYSGVRYALNEMYARRGYPFKKGPIRHQFHKFSWYHPVPGLTQANVEAHFTPIEIANEHLLAERRDALTRAGKAIK